MTPGTLAATTHLTPRARARLRRRLAGAHPTAELRRRLAGKRGQR